MDSQIGKASQQPTEHPPQLWGALTKRRLKEVPNERHEARMEALYVDISDDGLGWNRPCKKTEKEFAHGTLEDAMNAYDQRRGDLLTPELLRDPALTTALQAWSGKPDLVHLPYLPMDCDSVYR